MRKAYANTAKVRFNLLVLLLSLMGFWITATVASSGDVGLIEEKIMYGVYNLPAFFAFVAYLVTQLGSVGVLFMAVLMALILRRKKLAALMFADGVMAYGLAAAAKLVVARPRPSLIYSDILVRYEVATGYGFPSGHTAIATALAFGLMPYTPKKYRWLLWVWILAVGFSRVYLGVHAPVDILGGFFIGAGVASFTRIVILSSQKNKSKS